MLNLCCSYCTYMGIMMSILQSVHLRSPWDATSKAYAYSMNLFESGSSYDSGFFQSSK
ncbi:unnamed protein product [Moneuplotes crassus]|uniref:Uncharacterized protein n=1 Tax=Euplotes crassus TaxID=5936 RepID=A0AAD1UHR7_EUPCR|nr:unnamed protein product [Moneuplotes crassus]